MTKTHWRGGQLRAAGVLTLALAAGALAVPAAAHAATATYDLSNGGVNVTVQGGEARVTQGSTSENFPLAEPVIVTSSGTETTNRLRVNTSGLEAADTLTVRLSDAKIKSNSSPITLSGSGVGTLRLELLGENSAASTGDAGISVQTRTDTTIDVPAGFADAAGTLTASAINSAGIGAYTVLGRADDPDPDPNEDPATRLPGVHVFPDWHEAGETAPGDTYAGETEEYAGEGHGVTISGGTIIASSDYGAGIGGAEGVNGRNSDPVVILGGHVKAYSEHGAAIGGGNGGSWSDIIVSGGFVEAESEFGEALGGGWTGGSRSGAPVRIDGGTVLAQSHSKPPFAHRSAYPVSIVGGSVQAFGKPNATARGAESQPVFPAVARLLPDADGAPALLSAAAASGYGTADVVTTTMRAGLPGTNGTPGWVSPWLPASDSGELTVTRLDESGATLGTASYTGEIVEGTGGHLRMPLPAPTVQGQEASASDPVTITATLTISGVPDEVAPVRWAVLPADDSSEPVFQDSAVFPGLKPETEHRMLASVPLNDWYASPSEGVFTSIAGDDDGGDDDDDEGEGEGEGGTPEKPAPPTCKPGGPAELCETGAPSAASGALLGGILLALGAGLAWVARSRRRV